MKYLHFYFIAFIEGASLMSFQLLISRIIANSYGVTLVVWSIIISTTLLGLAAGYFFGGYFTSSNKKKIILFISLLISALLAYFIPLIGKLTVINFMSLSNPLGIILFSFCMIMPIVFLFGTITPLLIDRISEQPQILHKAKVAGKIYAVSTIGGIVGTFLWGLYFIPYCGIEISSIIMTSVLVIATILALIINR